VSSERMLERMRTGTKQVARSTEEHSDGGTRFNGQGRLGGLHVLGDLPATKGSVTAWFQHARSTVSETLT
jgi:hypothetical protein